MFWVTNDVTVMWFCDVEKKLGFEICCGFAVACSGYRFFSSPLSD
jgi:hypothetical protein